MNFLYKMRILLCTIGFAAHVIYKLNNDTARQLQGYNIMYDALMAWDWIVKQREDKRSIWSVKPSMECIKVFSMPSLDKIGEVEEFSKDADEAETTVSEA
jgi:hypothetical protein